MKFCEECFAETTGVESKCEDCIEAVLPKKKIYVQKGLAVINRKESGIEMFLPEDEGITWFNVPSPYKKYKEGV